MRMKVSIGLGISTLTFLFGAWHITLGILAVMMFLDIFTGILKGIMLKQIRSRRLSDGLFRKAGFVVLIILAQMMDLWVGAPLFRNLVVGLLIANEAISIIENLTQMGVPIPRKLTQFLEIVREGGGDIDKAKAELKNIQQKASSVEKKLENIQLEETIKRTEEKK